MAESSQVAAEPRLPRITIQFCTQCKWMLRAAYINKLFEPSSPLELKLTTQNNDDDDKQYAQELLSTFSTSLGEVALQPGTGGVFVVEITHSSSSANSADEEAATRRTVLWDRKVDVGFPETKELKRRVRDVIQPGRDLGHVDRDYARRRKGDDDDGEEEAGGKAGLKEGAVGRKEEEGEEGKATQERKMEEEGGEKRDKARVRSVEGQREEVCEDCQ